VYFSMGSCFGSSQTKAHPNGAGGRQGNNNRQGQGQGQQYPSAVGVVVPDYPTPQQPQQVRKK
jgi:hypothetical protein